MKKLLVISSLPPAAFACTARAAQHCWTRRRHSGNKNTPPTVAIGDPFSPSAMSPSKTVPSMRLRLLEQLDLKMALK